MGKTDDDITLLLLLQELSHLSTFLYRILILDDTIVGLTDQAFQLRTKSEDTNLDTLAMENHVRLDDACQFCTREIVVGTDDRELRHLEDTHHIVNAKVKLMVADGSSVILHLVHQANLHVALEERIVRRTLRKVATIEKQEGRMNLSLFLDHRHTAKITTTICHRRISEVRIDRHHTRMGIIGMEHYQLLYRFTCLLTLSLCLCRLHRQHGKCESYI